MADLRKKFVFRYLEGKKSQLLNNKDNQNLLLKWGMKDRLNVQTYTFDQPFQIYEKDQFVLDFFQDENVCRTLQVLLKSGKWNPIGNAATSVTATVVPASVVSMAFFNKLTEDDHIVRASGHIKKCLDEFIGDFVISDELRQMLLNEDSDAYCTFHTADRDQFLFRLFEHMCLGGQICQHEDNIDCYLDFTKQMYKDLISVQKDADSSQIRVTSVVFKVTARDSHGSMYYPSHTTHRQSFAYLIVDPVKRQLTVLHHLFGQVFT